jgi:hypothetical protein
VAGDRVLAVALVAALATSTSFLLKAPSALRPRVLDCARSESAWVYRVLAKVARAAPLAA